MQLPNKLHTVRPISNTRSIPKIKAKPSTGSPKAALVAATTIKEPPGTPAIPLVDNIKVIIIKIC